MAEKLKTVWVVRITDHLASDIEGSELWARFYPSKEAALEDVKGYVEERRTDDNTERDDDGNPPVWESEDPDEGNCQWRVSCPPEEDDGFGYTVFEFEISTIYGEVPE